MRVTLSMLGLLLAAGFASAQTPPADSPPAASNGAPQMNRLDRMAILLDLTPQQKLQVQQVLDEERQQARVVKKTADALLVHDFAPLRGATIEGTGRALPDHVLTNADFEKMVDTTDEWIVTRTGIRERRRIQPGDNNSDYAVRASQRALEAGGLTAQDVDHILIATVTPDRILPSMSCTVQNKLGATHAACLDLNAACSGFLYGLQLAQSLIESGASDTVLLLGAETLTRITDYEDRNTCVLFGDGAGAIVLRPCAPGTGVLSVRVGADGSQGDMLTIPAGGSERPASHETVAARDHFIKMRGNELFKYAVRAMEQVSRDALAEAGRDAAELALLVPHQANQRIIAAAADRLGVGPEKVKTNIEHFGNTSAASIPILLDEVVGAGEVNERDLIELVAFGGGVTWGAAVVEWNPKAAVPLVPREARGRMGAVRSGAPA